MIFMFGFYLLPNNIYNFNIHCFHYVVALVELMWSTRCNYCWISALSLRQITFALGFTVHLCLGLNRKPPWVNALCQCHWLTRNIPIMLSIIDLTLTLGLAWLWLWVCQQTRNKYRCGSHPYIHLKCCSGHFTGNIKPSEALQDVG